MSAVKMKLKFKFGRAGRRAFTLVEIMIVVAIIGIVMAMGIPSMVHAMKKEGLRKAVSDMVEACSSARADAILKAHTSDVVIRPKDRTISGGTFTATVPESVWYETLYVNFAEFRDDVEEIRVHFYANGTSDEFTIVFNSDENKRMQIDLEVVTGLADVKPLK